MNDKKEKQVQDFQYWLISHDIQFVQKPNGQFNIFMYNKIVYTVWVTTEKLMIVTSCQIIVGMEKIKRTILEAYYTTAVKEVNKMDKASGKLDLPAKLELAMQDKVKRPKLAKLLSQIWDTIK